MERVDPDLPFLVRKTFHVILPGAFRSLSFGTFDLGGLCDILSLPTATAPAIVPSSLSHFLAGQPRLDRLQLADDKHQIHKMPPMPNQGPVGPSTADKRMCCGLWPNEPSTCAVC